MSWQSDLLKSCVQEERERTDLSSRYVTASPYYAVSLESQRIQEANARDRALGRLPNDIYVGEGEASGRGGLRISHPAKTQAHNPIGALIMFVLVALVIIFIVVAALNVG